MDPSALQLQKNAGKRYFGPTSVRVPNTTREWIKRHEGMTLAAIINYGPTWRDKMEELAEQVRRMSEGQKVRDATIARLTEENAELLRFKSRTMERVKKEGVKAIVRGA